MSARDVWITGYGLINALGESPEAWWSGLAAPEAWRARIDAATYAPFPIHPVGAYDIGKQIPKPGDQKAMGPTMHYGVYAAGLALDMAGIKGNAELLLETHIVAAAPGGERDWELDRAILAKLGEVNDKGAFINRQLADGLRPTLFLQQLPNLFAGNISLVYGVSGSSRTFMGEEAAGVDAVRIAQRRIEGGQGDIFLVGASFSALRPDFQQQYHAGGIMHVGPWRRLWDRPQAGMILGSAGAFLVLEARERAERRGAKPRARLAAIASGRSDRTPGAAALLAQAQWDALGGRISPEGTLGVLSGACGIGAITREERDWLAALARRRRLAVRGTAGALGHCMESAFLQNLVLAAASLERGSLFAPIDAEEPLEAAEPAPAARQILVTSWGHNKGEGLGVVEKV